MTAQTVLDLLQRLTDLGESAVLSAVVAGLCVYFLVLRRRRDAAAVAMAYIFAAGAIAVLKLVFIGCGHDIFDIRSPSGHTALSVASLGTLGVILIRNKGRRGIWPAMLLGVIAASIAISRIILHYHTGPEALAGALTGIIAIFVADRLSQKVDMVSGQRDIRMAILFIVVIVAIAVTYGHSLPAEREVTGFAFLLRQNFSFCR